MPLRATSGLTMVPPGPRTAAGQAIERQITDEAAIAAMPGEDLRVDVLVPEGAAVAQGAPLVALHADPGMVLTAPMAGRLASVDLGPGRRLREVRLFREDAAGRHVFDVDGAANTPDRLRALLRGSGLWQMLRSRPFGRVPAAAEVPAAIFVMACDTRPMAPDPRRALAPVADELERGLAALAVLSGGPVILCQDDGADLAPPASRGGVAQIFRCGGAHPWGLAGLPIHSLVPARQGRPVWDVHAEDVAAIGTLLTTGSLPETRLVSVAGEALKVARLVRCQPGADLRSLWYGIARPGPVRTLSGSALDGHAARWLGRRDRQVTALPSGAAGGARHWLLSALRGASRPLPTIPTAAVDAALGGAIPAVPFLRALAAGDVETLAGFDAWSLLPEDLALLDYVTAADPPHSALFAALLARLAEEAGA